MMQMLTEVVYASFNISDRQLKQYINILERRGMGHVWVLQLPDLGQIATHRQPQIYTHASPFVIHMEFMIKIAILRTYPF